MTPDPLDACARGAPLVLLVDDDPDLRDCLCELLCLSGFRVVTASTLADALRQFVALVPQAVVTELRLRGEPDGAHLCRAIRQFNGRATLVVAHTSWVSQATRHDADLAGFDGFLPKPAEPEDLIRMIQERCTPS